MLKGLKFWIGATAESDLERAVRAKSSASCAASWAGERAEGARKVLRSLIARSFVAIY